MTLTDVFRRLGAPLANSRWSWGSVRADGIVFLRVFQDEIRKHDGARYVRLTNHERFDSGPVKPGFAERLQHLEVLKNGATSYLVMCEAVDVKAIPREVKGFNEEEVFRGGSILELDGDCWIEFGERVSVRRLKQLWDERAL